MQCRTSNPAFMIISKGIGGLESNCKRQDPIVMLVQRTHLSHGSAIMPEELRMVCEKS